MRPCSNKFTLAIIGAIVVLSLVVAPIFRDRLNEQFLLNIREHQGSE